MNVLEEAISKTHGDRRAEYGHPLDDFSCTALVWTAYLRRAGLLKDGVEIPAELVPIMMTGGVKGSRLCGMPGHRDSAVDGAGYMRTLEMVIEEREARKTAGLMAPKTIEDYLATLRRFQELFKEHAHEHIGLCGHCLVGNKPGPHHLNECPAWLPV